MRRRKPSIYNTDYNAFSCNLLPLADLSIERLSTFFFLEPLLRQKRNWPLFILARWLTAVGPSLVITSATTHTRYRTMAPRDRLAEIKKQVCESSSVCNGNCDTSVA